MGRIIVILLNLYVIYLGFTGGIATGMGWSDGKYDDWEEQRMTEYMHTVTIYWDEYGTDYTTIDVREDMNWTIQGACGVWSLYSSYSPVNTSDTGLSTMLSYHLPEGKTVDDFAGLWTSAYGGTQYLNSAGYSLYNVKSDITLYAVWE
ncbi:MAG: hypothetical protein IJW60_04520 [Clostridia bacterium]|nr:hypothetical protein [Clostridia bacterium]